MLGYKLKIESLRTHKKTDIIYDLQNRNYICGGFDELPQKHMVSVDLTLKIVSVGTNEDELGVPIDYSQVVEKFHEVKVPKLNENAIKRLVSNGIVDGVVMTKNEIFGTNTYDSWGCVYNQNTIKLQEGSDVQ